MATQSQRTRKSAATRRSTSTRVTRPFHQTLSIALEALWKRTDDNGVCKGNGKQTIVMEALGITATQADHVNKCLAHLGLVSSNDKRGMGAAYTVGVELVEVTAEMAAKAIEAIGPVPKAKTASTKLQAARRSTEKKAPQPTTPETPSTRESTQHPNIDPDAPNNIDRLIEMNHRLNAALTAAQEELERLRHDNGELLVQNEKLSGQLSHYEGGSSDIDRVLAVSEELLSQHG